MAEHLREKPPEIRSYYKPNKTQYDELRHVYRRFEEMKDARADFETKWTKNWKQYNSYRPTQDTEEWQSTIFIPLTAAIVEAMLSEMVDQSPQPFILPRDPTDKAAATVLKHAFNYTWEIGDGDIELYKVLKSLLVTGTGIAQEYYLETPRKIKEIISFDPEKGIEEYEEKEILDFADPYMEYVKNNDFYPDDKGRSMRGPHGLRDCVRRYIMHIDDFRDFFDRPIWNDLGNVKYVKPGGDTNYYEFYKPAESINKEHDVEVFWYWNKPDDKLIVVANDVVVRSSPNPYSHKQLPFACAVDIMDLDKFWGKGEADLLESLNEELNLMRRMRLDRQHLSIDQMFLKSPRADLDEEDLVVRPHGFIEAEEGQITPLALPDIGKSAYLEEDRLKDDAVRVTGHDERMASVQTPGTATEAAILKESTLKRIRLKLRLLEKGFLTDIGRLRIAVIQQYYSVSKIEKILGDKESARYQLQIEAAKKQDRFSLLDGQPAEETYRSIRIRDKELQEKKTGEIIERPISGLSFFQVNPSHLRGQFDITVQAGSNLPISKPLLQQRTETLVQQPVIAAAIERGVYDLKKVADALLKVHDFNPDDWRIESAEEELAVQEEAKLAQSTREIELANRENEMMMNGKPVGPTPYASAQHTQIHYQFMRSEEFIRLPNNSPVVKLFRNHVAGEAEAQGRRGAGGETPGFGPRDMGGQPPPQMPGGVPAGKKGEQAAIKAAIPGLVQGQGPQGTYGEG